MVKQCPCLQFAPVPQQWGTVVQIRHLQDPLSPFPQVDRYASVREEVEGRGQRLLAGSQRDLKRRAVLLYVYKQLNAEGVRIGKALDTELELLILRATEADKAKEGE